jgi:hypothetical protein
MKSAAAALCLLTVMASAAVAVEPSFKAAMTSTERLTKGQAGGYFYKRGTLYDHIWEGMTVPDNNYHPTALADGNYIFFGWRRHSAFEKSAIVTLPSGEMLAAGLMHYPRCQDNDSRTACTDGSDLVEPVVTIFLRRSHQDENLAQHLRDWAMRANPKVTVFETKLLPN